MTAVWVRANAVVDPAALPAMCEHMRTMLAHLPNVRANMIAHGSELHLYGEDQHISDLIEFRDERGERKFTNPNLAAAGVGKVDIDLYADGLGGVYSACPGVNVLHQHDFRRPHAEVCVHEFAHNIMNFGLDAGMRAEIEKRYNAAKTLWKGAYAATNANEFFAEMSSWYFGGQGGVGAMERAPEAGAEALRGFDPETYALIERIYAGRKQPKVVKFHPVQVIRNGGAYQRGMTFDPAELLLVNNTGARMQVYFARPDGTLTDMGLLEPYTRRLQQTYTSQTWVVEDRRTRAQTLFLVNDAHSQFVVEEASR